MLGWRVLLELLYGWLDRIRLYLFQLAWLIR